MCLAKIVFFLFAWTTVTNHVLVSGEEKDELLEPPEEKTEPPPVENHTFVALIEIVFADGSKRQCTGTIIHDNVIVTAAHCFLDHVPTYVDIELSSSFVVIGTKKMFDTGYENYLPIERIVTHPRYKGWTADIALVFTFEGMVTGKPGNAIPLVEESTSTPVDSNVTILSWGRCADDAEKPPATKWPGEKKRRCTSSEEQNESCEPASTYKPLRAGARSSEQAHSSEPASSQHRSFQADKSDESTVDLARVTTAPDPHRALATVNVQKLSQDNALDKPNQPNEPPEPLESLETPPVNVTIGLDNQTISIGSPDVMTAEAKVRKKENLTKALRRHRKRHYQKTSRNMPIANVKENTLTIETFGFVNVQTCKKLVDKVLPPLYGINTNEVVCYAAEEHYISDDDSGAPAVSQGRLVAVTLGGVECDGDHVAIGMKMNCFCSWIAQNLPEKNVDWKCCKDCCSGDEPKIPRKLRNKNE